MTIAPRSQSRKWDIMRVDDYTYIMRNDLSNESSICLRFKKMAGENQNDKQTVYALYPELGGGDHYVGYSKDGKSWKYKIFGNQYVRYSSVEEGGSVGPIKYLHNDFFGGHSYFQSGGLFGMIAHNRMYVGTSFGKKATANANMPFPDNSYLCVWGNDGNIYFLIEDGRGPVVVRYKFAISPVGYFPEVALREKKEIVLPISVRSFLPGGLSDVEGETVVKWVPEGDGYDNRNGTKDESYSETFTWHHGVNESHTESIENTWEVSTSAKAHLNPGIFLPKTEISLRV